MSCVVDAANSAATSEVEKPSALAIALAYWLISYDMRALGFAMLLN